MKTLYTSLLASLIALSSFTSVNASTNSVNSELTPIDFFPSNMTLVGMSDDDSFDITNYLGVMDGVLLDNIGSFTWNMMQSSLWWQTDSYAVTIDLGSNLLIQEIMMQVSNNDTYQVDYSIDNENWSSLLVINAMDRRVLPGTAWKVMDSNSLSAEYAENIDFAAVNARYLKISASGGDNMYAISELQAFTGPQATITQALHVSPVPEPSTILLFGSGLIILLAARARQKKSSIEA